MSAYFSRNKAVLSTLIFVLILSVDCFAGIRDDGDSMMMGIPFGGGISDSNIDICPQGARVVSAFLDAWEKNDYKTMYALIDSDCKKDYSYEDAKFDFEFLNFKEFTISSVRRQGDNYEFILSYGSWQYGDKDIQKLLISGRSFKIIMLSRGVYLKKSADSYF